MKDTHLTNSYIKYASLLVLTGQNALLALTMRYARVRITDDMFISSTAVVTSEVVKLLMALALVFRDEGFHVVNTIHSLKVTVIDNALDTIKVCIPSLLYVFQNNLMYLSASHLDVGTFQVTYQFKILTTAFFSVLLLSRSLSRHQWGSLLLLVIGIATVQLSTVEEHGPRQGFSQANQNRTIGLVSALCACFLSGLAGVYFERILKGSDVTPWMRNVQLSLLSIPLALVLCFINDGRNISVVGFFHGYDSFIIFLVCVQACGGLLVAMVVKYADNILKGFACSLAIVVASVASIPIFGLVITAQFAVGTLIVLSSIFIYQKYPHVSPSANEGFKAKIDSSLCFKA